MDTRFWVYAGMRQARGHTVARQGECAFALEQNGRAAQLAGFFPPEPPSNSSSSVGQIEQRLILRL